uniref:Alpha-latrotoxin-Lt1a n=1 Tax=Lygus hesperus TaxID=30085 RepID=A0A0A9YHW6_LYGHE
MIVAPVAFAFLLCAFLPFAFSSKEVIEELENSIKQIDELTKENKESMEPKTLEEFEKMKEDAIKLKNQMKKQMRKRRRGGRYRYFMRQANSLNRMIMRNLSGFLRQPRKKKRGNFG